MASEGGTKVFSISIDVSVPADMSPEDMAQRLEGVVAKSRPDRVDFSKLTIRTIPRELGAAAAGYDTRLWEKATC